MQPSGDRGFGTNRPPTSDAPVLKRPREETEETTEVLDPILNAHSNLLALADELRSLKFENAAPESLDALCFSVDNFDLVWSEFKKDVELAEQRSRLDPDNFQSTEQFGVNPLHLTNKKIEQSAQQKSFAVETIVDGQPRIELIRRGDKNKTKMGDRTAEESMGTMPADYKTFKLTINEVCYKDVRYQDLQVNVKQYAHRTPNGKATSYTQVYLCPFFPVCTCWLTDKGNSENHVRTHFSAPVYFCFNCRFVSVLLNVFNRHLTVVCAPYLIDQDEIETVVALAKSRKLQYADFQFVGRQLWNTKKVNAHVIAQELGDDKLALLQTHFSLLFDLPTQVVSLNAEFSELIDKLCPPNPINSNDYHAVAYGVFETTNDLDKKSAAGQNYYVGSECESSVRKGNNLLYHRRLVKDARSKSQTFHTRLAAAKRKGRTFSIVPILVGIQNDRKVGSKWDKARCTFEDAFKTMFECLSNDIWNKLSIARNSSNDTYECPTEKRMLFALFVYHRQWNFIKAGLDNPENQL